MPMIGWLRRMAPVEPKKAASPKAKTPPSVAVSQYPSPEGVASMATIGWLSRRPASEPSDPALPKAKTAPSEPAIQYPGELARPAPGEAGPEEPGKGGGGVELPGSTNSPSDDQSEPADQPTTASVPGTGRPLRKSTAWSSPPLA